MQRSAVRELLAQYVPVESDPHAQHMRRLLDGPGNPFAPDHFDPGHFTASGFVLSPRGDSILMIFHEKLERWLQPGGHVEPTDPSLAHVAAREVLEETAVRVDAATARLLDLDVHVIPARRDQPQHLHFDVRFLFRASTLDVAAASDAREARWVALEQVQQMESDDSVMRAVSLLQSMQLQGRVT